MERVTEIWMLAFGLSCAGIGLAHLLFGTSTIIGGGSVNATIDSDLRFYALLFGRVANVLGAIFFAGGLARLLAWAVTGQPNWFYVVMIPVELLIPVVNYALIRHVTSAAS